MRRFSSRAAVEPRSGHALEASDPPRRLLHGRRGEKWLTLCAVQKQLQVGSTEKAACVTARIALAFTLLALAMGGSGCIVVPIYTNRVDVTVRTNVALDAVNLLGSTNTSRSEVLLQLGEPDEVSVEERQLRFHTERIKWDIYWAVAAGYSAQGGDIEVRRFYDLVLRFDQEGRLLESSWLEGPAQNSQKQKAYWSASAPAAKSGP